MDRRVSPLRIGIAGLGQAGSTLVPAIHRHPHATLTSAADPNALARDAFTRETQAEVYEDIEALCGSPAIDLVYVATPTHMHAHHVLMALAHDKHVIVEKPMALTLGEAGTMVALAQQRGLKLIVGHSQSFEPPIRAMRDLVQQGEIGPLRMLHTLYYTDWLYRPRNPQELNTSLGGGVLFRQGAHQVDLLRWIGGGLVQRVRAMTGAWDATRPTEGAHVLLLTFQSGVVATAVFSGYDHFHSTELTFGIDERGRRATPRVHARARAALRASGGDAGEAALKRTLGYGAGDAARQPETLATSFYGLTIVTCERGDIRQKRGGLRVYGDDQAWNVRVPSRPTGRDLLLAEAYDAIARDTRPAHDGAWGRANLEVCLAALQSAREQCEVDLILQVPTPDQSGSR